MSYKQESADRRLPSSVVLIYNFFGGGGKENAPVKLKALELFESELKKAGIKVDKFKTARAGHAVEIISSLPLESTELIVIWGGDGTVQEAVTGLMRRTDDMRLRVPLTLVAAGSGNALAATLGLRRGPSDKTTEDSLEARVLRTTAAIVSGKVQKMDVTKITFPSEPNRLAIFSTLIFQWGAGVQFLSTTESLRKQYGVGENRYIWAALHHLLYQNYFSRPMIRLTVDDEYVVEYPASWEDSPNDLVVANFSEMQGYGVSPLAQGDDGKLEAHVIPRMSKADLRKFAMAQTKNRQFIAPLKVAPMYFRFSKLLVEFADPNQKPTRPSDVEIASDGTLLGVGFPFVLECIPGAILLCIPQRAV